MNSTHMPDFKVLFTLPLSLNRKGHGLLIYSFSTFLPFSKPISLRSFHSITLLLSLSLQIFTIVNNLRPFAIGLLNRCWKAIEPLEESLLKMRWKRE